MAQATILNGVVDTKGGYHVAGENLVTVLHLIEKRSGLRPLIPNTMNVRLVADYTVVPTFVVTRQEYKKHNEELRFCPCTVAGIPCLLMRPDSHERGSSHGRAYLEVMSTVWLRETLGLVDGSPVAVEIPVQLGWKADT